MNRCFPFYLFCLLISSFALSQSTPFKSKFTAEHLSEAPVKIIPYPQEVEWKKRQIDVNGVQISDVGSLDPSIVNAIGRIVKEREIKLSDSGLPLRFKQDSKIPGEGYTLEVDKHGILIGTSSESGQFYALQTLRQLLVKEGGKIRIQSCRISDHPAFEIRGLMIDVGRNYQTMDFLKEQLDIMANYKLNTFQWHLTDRPAWRIESKAFPQLTAAQNHRPTRDPGMFYTYDQIRELFSYARERHIQIIPEIDMPGHSDSFVTSMGFKMETQRGIKALKIILEEFFKEIPKEWAPIVHIGSDEVEVPNPEEFMQTMVSYCKGFDREVMIWNPGLPTDLDVIRQGWRPEKVSGNKPFREIDSWNSYVNNGEPYVHISKLFFKPIGEGSHNSILGGILCVWNDVNLKQGADLIRINPVYPSLLTYAWKTWTDDVSEASRAYLTKIPLAGSTENSYFDAFEDYLMDHKQRYFQELPFQYTAQAHALWQLVGPIDTADSSLEKVRQSFETSDSTRIAAGNSIYIRDRFQLGGYFKAAKAGENYFARTFIYSGTEKEIPVWIGFETPYRANRTYNGVPEAGNWDAAGGSFWINGDELAAPKWRSPGWKPQITTGWGKKEDQEIAWEDEELYWTREAVKVPLKKGWNEVIFKVPGISAYQNWMFTFAPLGEEELKYSISPNKN